MASVIGGTKLEAALSKISANVTKASSVEIGWPSGATADDGEPIALRAAMAEFGHGNTPARPFFRTMVANKSPEWPKEIAAILKASGYDAEKALGQEGEHIADELRQAIIDFTSPGLSALTIMLRGMRSQARYRDMPFGKLIAEAKSRVAAGDTNYGASTKPLVDTGQMLEKIVSVVKS